AATRRNILVTCAIPRPTSGARLTSGARRDVWGSPDTCGARQPFFGLGRTRLSTALRRGAGSPARSADGLVPPTFEGGRPQGLGDMKPLADVAAHLTEQLILLGGLDAFGGDLQLPSLPEMDH